MHKTCDDLIAVDMKLQAKVDLKQTNAALVNISIAKITGDQLFVEQMDATTQKIKKVKIGAVP